MQQSSFTTFKRLWPLISVYKKGFIIAVFMLIFNAAVNALLLSLLKPLLDEGFGQSDTHLLKIVAFGLFVLFFLRGATSFIASYCLAWVSGKIVMFLRRRLFSHFMSMPVSFFDQNPTGELLSRITYDSEQVANSSSDVLVTVVKETATVIFLVALMLYSSWKLTLILFVIAPIIAYIITVVSKLFRKISLNMQEAMGRIATRTEQMINGHKVVLSYNGKEIEQKHFNEASNQMRRYAMDMIKVEGLSNLIVQVIASLALSVVILLASYPKIFFFFFF